MIVLFVKYKFIVDVSVSKIQGFDRLQEAKASHSDPSSEMYWRGSCSGS